MITQEKLKELLSYDKDTGIFTWAISGRKIYIGKIAGSKNNLGYVLIEIDGKKHRAHRLAWLYMTGSFPKDQIDHINGIKHDNKFVNLRESTQAKNVQNIRKPTKNNTTGYLGVCFNKRNNNFVASIRFNGKQKTIGYYKNAELAYEAYLNAKRETHEYCTI